MTLTQKTVSDRSMREHLWSWATSLHCLTTAMMAGLVLLVHVVHYPLFSYVSPVRFADMHRAHATRITYIVGPLMLAELMSAAVVVYLQFTWFWCACLALSCLCFLLTGLLAVPLHSTLARGWNEAAFLRLVKSNICRTLVWLLHAAMLGGWLAGTLRLF